MPLISSKMTFFYKRISPIIWFGLLAVFILVGLLKGGGSFLVVTVLLAIVSYRFMKRMVFNLVDEVFDVGDALLVRSGGREERIALADIKNVNYSPHMSPPQVTLSLRRLTVFGDTIVFLPPVRPPFGPELPGNIPTSKGLGALGERGVLCAPTAHQTNGIIGVSPEAE
jgi:hypothetical protein